MITISTKELRNNFPAILEKLANGEDFLLIHRSQPVAEIRKPQTICSFSEATEKEVQKSALRDVSQDFLSPEELNYYLSLS